MRLRTRLVFAASLALILLPVRILQAAPADQLKDVLNRLDAAAAKFHTTSADFVFDTEQTDPVPDTDIQKGHVFYKREGGSFQMAAHIEEANNRPVIRTYTYADGQLRVYDKPANQITTLTKARNYESYLMLGFGASGKELADKWDIKDLGSEIIDNVKTEKLELVAKDPDVRKNLVKVTIWVDPDRAVSLRQRFDENRSLYRICSYSKFNINKSLPRDAFTLPKGDANTTYINK